MPRPPPLRRVALLGGTHGNETNGVFVVDGYRRQQMRDLRRPSFSDVIGVISNPGAIQRTTRFVDEDLNRQFRLEWLRDPERASYEAQRAKALNVLLGPKPGSAPGDAGGSAEDPDAPAANGAVDFLIDLHTTTSNMGCTLIVSGQDRLSLCAATYARAWMDAAGMRCKIQYIALPRAEQPWVVSAARHGVIVEVGPSPWGVVRHDTVHAMREATMRMLDYVDAHNRGVAPPMPATPWGDGWARGGGGPGMPDAVVVNAAVIDPATGTPAKIPVPADENGRAAVMFHPDMQDRDWRALRKGDAMFVGFDGDVQRYDGRFGDVCAHFINEAAYYLPSSGLGFELSVEKEIPVTAPQPPAETSRL